MRLHRHADTPIRPDSAAIIVAGGKGLRFGGAIRKQYIMLRGRPILWWSARAFEKSPSTGAIILVVPAEDVKRIQTMVRAWRFPKIVLVVEGGRERRDSVRSGLRALGTKWRYVSVHDAVRPLVNVETIESCLKSARRFGAALAACPSKDTLKIADAHGWVRSSPARETVWLAQTPQTFRRDWLEKAHAKGIHWPVTDDAQMVERLGHRVKIVPAPVENLKVTTPMDFMIAKAVIARSAATKQSQMSEIATAPRGMKRGASR
jgi:2-C-methyl-D-erythritol 4-phosphate cytidylyltransferase